MGHKKNCICCKKTIIVANKRTKYCNNCAKYINYIICHQASRESDKIKNLREDLEKKYKHIAIIREVVKQDKDINGLKL